MEHAIYSDTMVLAMFKDKNRVKLLIILSTFLVVFSIVTIFSVRNKEHKENENKSESTTLDKPKCTDTDLRIEALDPAIKQNPTAMNLIRTMCRWALAPQYMDVDGDGTKELIMYSIGYGCGSCHAGEVSIFKGNDLMFDMSGDELSIKESKMTTGFEIHEPLRRSEAWSRPVEEIIYTYKYSPSYSRNSDDMVGASYNSFTSVSNVVDTGYFYLYDTRTAQLNYN